MKLIPEILQAQAEIRAIRRDIHAHPELCFEEQRTADVVARNLESWGIEVHRGLGTTGLVGVIRNGGSARTIGLRADMDALPLQEANTFGHCSQHAGKMHACGHDGHTAMLLGAARYLAQHKPFDGTVHLIFQPAEEGGGGAREMIKDGLFSRFPCDAVFGVHNWPGMPVGAFGTRVGPLMASSNEFRIVVRGKGAHAAMPHNGNDPVFTAAQIVSALQGIITRNKRPIDTAVISVTQFHAGDATNIVPNEAWIGGTVRTFTVPVLDLIERRMEEVSRAVASAFDCTVDYEFHRNYPPTINTEAETGFAATVAAELVGEANVDSDIEPTMGAEDFSFMLQEKPGCYLFLGNGDGAHRDSGHGMGPCMLHNPSYDFNDELLPVGSTFFVRLVEKWLAPA
ncbi:MULTISPECIES: M20 aminoacylase family protein [Cupriavidus]|uniref:Amidohydrolase n=1 Tax=Cupriavidus oxalaticus TaxID=96344 RepID=A0A4P7LFJ8_9BURK|nr:MULTISPECIES: M20 aminoacylase family protein [Cupriavidus]QBY54378.1 amidohydrolase [Cupriavidus oxalaticus]TDF61814.1 amidohydrolase [Cupriavidus sp. L7L]